jgi:Plant transposon protein
VERAFGVIRRKFQVLKKPIEWWCLNDIKDFVKLCNILHNMMVEVRIIWEEKEDSNFCFCDDDKTINERIIDKVSEDVERAQTELDLIRRTDAEYYKGDAVNVAELDDNNKKSLLFVSS